MSEPTSTSSGSAFSSKNKEDTNTASSMVACDGCGLEFASRNAVFRHLKETNGACLDPKDYDDFSRYVMNRNLHEKRKKVLLLFGYIPTTNAMQKETNDNNSSSSVTPTKEHSYTIQNGQDAGQILLETIEELILSSAPPMTSTDTEQQQQQQQPPPAQSSHNNKVTRSYGNNHRSLDILAQDEGTAAITELISTKLPPLNNNHHPSKTTGGVEDWIQQVNERLHKKNLSKHIRLFGRKPMPFTKFNAEMDVSHRRIEYLLPADFLYNPASDHEFTKNKTRLEFFQSFPSFMDGHYSPERPNERAASSEEQQQQQANPANPDVRKKEERPDLEMLGYLHFIKKKMQSITTKVVQLDTNDYASVVEKNFHRKKRQRQRKHKDGENKTEEPNNGENEEKEEEEDELGSEENQESQHSKDQTKEAALKDEKMMQNDKQNGDNTTKSPKNKKKKKKKKKEQEQSGENQQQQQNVLKRRRFHNFTPKVMAHEYLAFRRLDRLYHRATLRYDNNGTKNLGNNNDNRSRRPFLVFSISGDMFLNGQGCRIMGVFIALARGIIPDDIIDCIFDENYPHLVPTPPVPTFALCAGEAYYMTWEGKVKSVLSPRRCDRYDKNTVDNNKNVAQEGNQWNEGPMLQEVQEWKKGIRENIAQQWMIQGEEVDEMGSNGSKEEGAKRLVAEKQWIETVLEPWAERARVQLQDYRNWKRSLVNNNKQDGDGGGLSSSAVVESTSNEIASHEDTNNSTPRVSLELMDKSVPTLYEKVLYYLREADSSGQWPSTSAKRQMVMISTPTTLALAANSNTNDTNPTSTSLSIAHMKARANRKEEKKSDSDPSAATTTAYSFAEGQGGASGSFSVGAMPGELCKIQPRANSLFPELMKAAFELEIALCIPNREPSSTIAINRNAQFRPHIDSGAGAGQHTSLIVGLGNYTGGELMVENVKQDIRYKPIEFNGWKQRHWTMPFQGERYSLVWFTPKGCEGVHGIDLCS